MEPEPLEKDREQDFFDYAAQCLTWHEEELQRAPKAAIHKRSAAQIKAYVDKERQTAVSGQAVAFGRIDDDADDKTYIGRHLIREPHGDVLVVNWQAPAAEPYFTATPTNPGGLVRKRAYECHDNTILDFADTVFASPDEAMDEFLTRVLTRGRTGRLHDIVATIQSRQFDIIRQPPQQTLIIGGGPGTGKTVIALHRVSWLLHHHPELRAGGVLVVGPDPTYLRYVSQVLPALGETGVELQEVGGLGPPVVRGHHEPLALARLKGDARMATVLARAVRNSIRMSKRAGSGEEPPSRRDPRALLRALLDSPTDLTSAASGVLSDDEIVLLRSGDDPSAWTDADVALLDELDNLVNGPQRRYAHIVVDEAQDLSPMQIRSIARRSDNGSLTLAGDVIESTGPWPRDSWDDLVADLPAEYRVHEEILHYSYRVPSRVHDFAARLYPDEGPSVPHLDVVREGPSAPVIHVVSDEERAARGVDISVAHAENQRFVGIVCPSRCHTAIADVLKTRGVEWNDSSNGELCAAINLVNPHEARGLEFDAVIVVEPEFIVAESPRGRQMLYTAFTRTTGYLDIVCAGEPIPLASSPDRTISNLQDPASIAKSSSFSAPRGSVGERDSHSHLRDGRGALGSVAHSGRYRSRRIG